MSSPLKITYRSPTVDHLLVGIAPVTLGGGAPLLPRRLTAADLELVDVVRDKQFARLSYRLRR
jgi:hypothetical protein